MPPHKRTRKDSWSAPSSSSLFVQQTEPLVERAEAPATSHAVSGQPGPTSGLVDFLLHNHDVRRLILECMNPRDFAMLCATNKLLRKVLFEERFDINQHLKRYFKDPLAFRRLLQKSGSFVSGTFPLSVFEGRVWRGGQFHVYVSKDYTREFGEFLSREKSFVERVERRDRRAWVFERTTPGRRAETIVIIRGDHPFFTDMLDYEDVTSGMCLMTWNKLICLFPYLTFQQHKMLKNRGVRGYPGAVNNFEENGWPREDLIQFDDIHEDGHKPSMIIGEHAPSQEIQKNRLYSSCTGVRRVEDSRAYHVRLNTEGIDDDATSVPSEVLDYCSFCMPPGRRSGWWTLSCTDFRHPLLKWTYTSVCLPRNSDIDNHEKGEIFNHIRKRLDKFLCFELSKLPLDQRPPAICDSIGSRVRRGKSFDSRSFRWDEFEKPATWRYLDHMIPEWYAPHEREQELYQAQLRERYQRRMRSKQGRQNG